MTHLFHVELNLAVIEALKIDKNIPRKERRKIAKDNKINWKVYQLLLKEYRRRVGLNLDIQTGKSKERNNNE